MAEELETQGTKTILTPDEYQNRLVDFYSQTLGQTGIDVEEEEDDKDDEGSDYVAPEIVPDSDSGVPNLLDIEYNMENIVNMDLPKSYEDHLASLGRDDKSDLGRLDKSIQDSNKKINNNLQKNFGISIGLPDQKQLKTYTSATALANVFGFGGMPVALGSSFLAGKTEKNIFGEDTFKPSGMLGVVQDVSESLRLNSYNQNKTKYTKIKNNFYGGAGEFSNVTDFNKHLRTQDFGFDATYRGSGGSIYRTEGSRIYNGVGMIGLDQETARRMEALSKGYDTNDYDPTNPSKSQSLVGAGYDERGYHHTIGGVAAMGREKDAIELGKMYGLSLTEVKNALGDVRSRRSTFGRTIEGKTLSQVLTEMKNAKQKKPTQVTSSGDDNTDTTVTQGDRGTTVAGGTVYEDPVADTTDPSYDDGGDDSSDDSGSVDTGLGGSGGEDFGYTAMGGRIGKQEGDVVVKEPGFIAPDANATKQQEIADDKPMDARDGDFIINAPAAEEAGKQDIQRMINTAIKNLKEKGVDVRFGDPKINIGDKVKLLVSRNEVYIPAIIAKEIGYDRLKKINNRGKREVQRRQEESQQDEKPQARGFIQKKKGDVVQGGFGAGFIDYDALRRNYGTTDMDQIIQKSVAGMFGVREQGEKAQEIAYNFARQNKFKDDDKSEDTLRHIIGGGLMADKKLGFTVYNLKENPYVNMIYGGLKGQGFTLPTGKAKQEGEIDLNNNEFGKALRQKYPNEKEFIKQAKRYLMDLRAGKEVKPVNGFRPIMSLGIIQREN